MKKIFAILLLALVYSGNASALSDLPVLGAYQEPWFWQNYGGSVSEFKTEIFEKIVKGQTPEQFVADLIAANGGEAGVKTEKLKLGTAIIKVDAFYVTYRNDKVVSVFISGENDALLPGGEKIGDDYLCFFKGPKAGTCAVGDDT